MSSRALAVVAIGAACTDAGDPDSGIVFVEILGFPGGTTNFGNATITGPDIAPIVLEDLPINTGSQSVRAGTYNVFYEAPAGFTMAEGSTNARVVDVVAGETTPVVFNVVAASGTIHIVVTGATSAPDGGTVAVLRTDIAGQVATVIPIPAATGIADTSVIPGTYRATYTPPTGYRLVAGQINPVNGIAVAHSATANVGFAIEQAPVATGVIFRSDWGTELGKSAAALRDTGKTPNWELIIGSTDPLTVIATGALGFPTTNCLQVDCVYGNPFNDMQEFATGEVSCLPGSGRFPVPAIGQSLYYRVYKRLVYPHSTNNPPPAGNNNHCLEERSGSGTNWSWTFNTAAGGWNPSFNVWVGGTPARFALGGGTPIYLNRNEVYRLEWRLHRTADMTRTHEVRIYNAAGAEIYDTGDFSSLFPATNLVGYSAALNHLQLDAVQLGTNGMGFGDGEGDVDPNEPIGSIIPAWYFAGFAISASDWLGPYNNGT